VWADTLVRTMDQLTDDVHWSRQSAQAPMAMSAHVSRPRTSGTTAPQRVMRDRVNTVSSGHRYGMIVSFFPRISLVMIIQHRDSSVLAFCRIIDYFRFSGISRSANCDNIKSYAYMSMS